MSEDVNCNNYRKMDNYKSIQNDEDVVCIDDVIIKYPSLNGEEEDNITC